MGEEVADGVLDSVLGPELLEDTLTDCMVDELFARMDTRQRVHEYTTALLEDVVDWIEIDLFDELWDHYVPAMLNSMLEVDEFRQGMLEYAGMERIKLKKRKGKQALPAKKGEAHQWFDEMFKSAQTGDPGIETKKAAAIRLLQAKVRSIQGRRRARKNWNATFSKQWDATHNACYYVNLKTQESSWEAPRIKKFLFPTSAW